MSGGHVVVDAANVVGSRPDGWWRDREGAARRLAGQLVAALAADPAELAAALGIAAPLTVHLVLEGRAARVDELPEHADLVVVRAPGAGDATIAAVAADLDGPVVVVTADRGLRGIVMAGGAAAVGPRALLAVLP
ncbi:MAG: hypothetical protein L0H84_10305 [Pseudonocardia sp.]|nr:hypothetical protein [Pseudonocardia sp.]